MSGINFNTKFISHWNGQNGGKEIIDDGTTGHVVTQVATAQLDTSLKQFGSTSLFLDGNSDYLSIPNSPDWDIFGSTSQDYTIDCWINTPLNQDGVVVMQDNAGLGTGFWDFVVLADGRLASRYRDNSNVLQWQVESASGLITANTWTHIAMIKVTSGGTMNMGYYINGIQVIFSSSTSTSTMNRELDIGVFNNSQTGLNSFFEGNIDEFHIQKSNIFSASPNVGLTDTITVPTGEDTSDTNTKLLLHLNSHDVSGDGTSGLYHIPIFIGTAQLDTSLKQFGSASLLLDGNSDRVIIANSPDWDIFANTTDQYTIDCWINTPLNQNGVIAMQDNAGLGTGFWDFVVLSDGRLASRFRTNLGVSAYQIESIAGIISANTWTHVALIKQTSGGTTNVGLYVNGQQVAFASTTLTSTYSRELNIGVFDNSFTGLNSFYEGNIDEFRLQKSNIFAGNPNVGLTDTIPVPTEEYTIEIPIGTVTDTKFDPITGRLRKENNLEGKVFMDYFLGETFLKIRED